MIVADAQGSISTSPWMAARWSSRPITRLRTWPDQHGPVPGLEQHGLQAALLDARVRRQHESSAVVPGVGDDGPARFMTRAIERHGQHVHRPHQCAEDRAGVGGLADVALEAVVERGDHAAVEAGAGHQQERLACWRART